MSKGGPDTTTQVTEPWKPLQPYIIGGDAGPNFGAPIPINYNWLDWANNAGAGTPGSWNNQPPPMNMNDPRMTMQNVHVPNEGGPWGFGLSPGTPMSSLQIPSQGGPQFIVPQGAGVGNPQPTGPGPVPLAPPAGYVDPNAPAAGGGLDLSQLDTVKQIMNYSRLMGQLGNPGGNVTELEALQWLGDNPGIDVNSSSGFQSLLTGLFRNSDPNYITDGGV